MALPSLVTRNVRVTVEAQFAPERSNVAKGVWFFVYTIVIRNEGAEPVKLLNRHWIITDAQGEVEEVRGAGVVGNQPHLGPGESFQYTSGCPLRTPFGSMHGSYEMTTDDGRRFDVSIPPFALRDPRMMQ
jgi:ApaG protein